MVIVQDDTLKAGPLVSTSDPTSFFAAPAPTPVAVATLEPVETVAPAATTTLVIAPEADPLPAYSSYSTESGDVSGGSDWFINIATYADIVWAERWKASLSEQGYPAVIIPFEKDGITLHRIRVVGYADEGEAQSDAILIEDALETGPPWVGCTSA